MRRRKRSAGAISGGEIQQRLDGYRRADDFVPDDHQIAPILLLIGSNVFMILAWYGHLKFTDRPLWIVTDCRCPGSRIGFRVYNPAQLKTIQEIITLIVFVVFSVTYLDTTIKWNHLVGFGLIVAAAFFIFLD